ncbi:MAG TPA: hypothetical protein VFW66_06430 [Gemmatimonadales bacterium]|nr:hypothetical protein [Gemmatimonadales bacterium]
MTDAWGSIRQESAEVMLAEGVRVEGSLHLLSRDAYPPGPETPLEMLNRPEAFFALTQADGGVLFVPKSQAAVLSCHHHAPPTDPERFSAAKLVALEVVVVGGTELRGRAALELPPSRARALDYVNGPDPFFALWTDDVTHYINKALVRTVRPHD